MKKLILTFFTCLMVVGLFAQKATIESFVDGKISKDAFVEQMTDYLQQYDLNAEQTKKVEKLINKKAENYTIIAEMKAKDPELFTSKMRGQSQHLIESLRYIMNQEQYRKFMIDVRSELASEKQTKAKK